ncbi:MAG: M15 family metallopeptidase [Spirochaetales bacterium]|nr:M15 family metallopeptidase [Spirochaetales bacterium]
MRHSFIISVLMMIISILLAMVLFVSDPAFVYASGTKKGIPAGLLKLKKTYPDQIESVTPEGLMFFDGEFMAYDDEVNGKDFEAMLDSPDLEDQMSFPYPRGRSYTVPIPENVDPGRIRYEPFFKKIYGKTKDEVTGHLVTIRWMPRTSNIPLKVTTVNDVHKRLLEISAECDRLPEDLKPMVSKPGGSFCYRNIRKTNRLSMHSFGIAIDITVRYSDYWLWDEPDSSGLYAYKNRIPLDIVEIFEKHGFIWGGKWYHYDTMHFEYRPELLIEEERGFENESE